MMDDLQASDEAAMTEVREIHALASPLPSSSSSSRTRRLSSSPSIGSEAESFTTLSREFNALVVAGSTMEADHNSITNVTDNLGRIGEEELPEETNPLAIVLDSNPIPLPRRANSTNAEPSTSSLTDQSNNSYSVEGVSVHRVKKEEVEAKIAAWQTAEIAKINNRFKREDVVINGWESEQIENATAWLKKIERKLDEQRARAMEKMDNDVAKAQQKAEERRASAEAKRGTKVAKILEVSNLLRTVGRAPSKRSFF